tara:strand:- start:230289 stop:230735 length:447 start_codon:yes stop_codon:yes gene_type:complete
MALHSDFREFIELAISMNLKFVIIGGWAYNRYAEPRATGDIDFFVEKSEESEKVTRELLTEFGFGSALPEGPLFEKDVIMLGHAPYRIDLLTKIDGVTFGEVWETREYESFYGLRVPFISLEKLIKNKASTGRNQDHVDVEKLRRKLT